MAKLGQLLEAIAPFRKAIAGALLGALLMYLKVNADGVTQDEWNEILLAAVSGAGLIYAVPNKTTKPPATE
jgi:hypothetical protein